MSQQTSTYCTLLLFFWCAGENMRAGASWCALHGSQGQAPSNWEWSSCSFQTHFVLFLLHLQRFITPFLLPIMLRDIFFASQLRRVHDHEAQPGSWGVNNILECIVPGPRKDLKTSSLLQGYCWFCFSLMFEEDHLVWREGSVCVEVVGALAAGLCRLSCERAGSSYSSLVTGRWA